MKANAAHELQQFLKHVGQGLLNNEVTELKEKAPLDLVTALDFWAERQVKEYLHEHFPDDTILSEETSATVNYAKRVWVLDPLDGTVNRANGLPFFAISLALLEEGAPIAGYVYAPAQDEMFEAHRGAGAFLNGKPIHVATGDGIGIAVTSKLLRHLNKHHPDQLHELLLKQGRLRNLGAQAIHLCYVAAGRLGAAASAETRLWDNAAGALLVEEAGGIYTDLRGVDPFPLTAKSLELKGEACPCLAASPELHSRLLPFVEELRM